MDRNTETIILCFFGTTGGILETQELFPKAHLTHKPTYVYLHLFMGSWNMLEYLDLDIFWLGDGRICKGFSQLCSLAPQI